MQLTRRRALHAGAMSAMACLLPSSLRALAIASAPSLDDKSFGGFPEGFGPQEIGNLVATRFLSTAHITDLGTVYSEVCAWIGALQFARRTSNSALIGKLASRFDNLYPTDNAPALPPAGEHVDESVFGALPLELYIATKNERYRKLGLRYADAQWSKPDDAGLSHETRFWIDDMYMVTVLQLQAFRATGDARYLDRAALQTAAYLDKLQQPNGLFFHAPDVKYFWGRGNGWFAVGMAELLLDLPASHRHHARVLDGYHRMMSGLLATQAQDGTWRELLDRPDSWSESSGTGMFTFAFVMGVRHGWLDAKQYLAPTRRAWQALAGFVDQNGDVVDVCQGTAKKDSLEWYLTRKRRTGDLRGQAPVLWTAAAML